MNTSVQNFVADNTSAIRSAMVQLAIKGVAKNTTATKVETIFKNLSEEEQSEVLALAGYDPDAVVTPAPSVKAPEIAGVNYEVFTNDKGESVRFAWLPISRFSNSGNAFVKVNDNLEILVKFADWSSRWKLRRTTAKNPLAIGEKIPVLMQESLKVGNDGKTYNNGLGTETIGGQVFTTSQILASAHPEIAEMISTSNANKVSIKDLVAEVREDSNGLISVKEATKMVKDEIKEVATMGIRERILAMKNR